MLNFVKLLPVWWVCGLEVPLRQLKCGELLIDLICDALGTNPTGCWSIFILRGEERVMACCTLQALTYGAISASDPNGMLLCVHLYFFAFARHISPDCSLNERSSLLLYASKSKASRSTWTRVINYLLFPLFSRCQQDTKLSG